MNLFKKVCKNKLVVEYREMLVKSFAIFFVILTFYGLVQLFGYKINLRRSIEDKILSKFIAYRREPQTRLFTVYGRELGFDSMDKVEYIQNGATLPIKTFEKNLFVGVWNNEGRSLESVSFIFLIPKDVEVTSREGWIEMFVNKQYNYDYPRKIRPNKGMMLHPPLSVKLLNKGPHKFEYKLLCDDFLDKDGYFYIEVK